MNLKRLFCIFGHKWYQDVKGIRGSGYNVPSEAFCIRCGRLEWIFNGCKYIPQDQLKEHIQKLETKGRTLNDSYLW